MSALRRLWARERALLTITVGGALLRLAWMRHATRPARELTDPFAYQYLAGLVSAGAGYVHIGREPTAYFPVGYPGALGEFFWLVGRTPWSPPSYVMASMFNFVPSVAAIVLTALIGRAVCGRRVGTVAGVLVACWPNLVFHSAVSLSETLFVALALGALYALVGRPWDERPGTTRLVVAGVLLGGSALVRPISLAWLPMLAIALYGGFRSWRGALGATAVVVLATAAVVAPWAVRNTATFRTPVLISTNMGDDLCIGHNPKANGTYRVKGADCLATDAGRLDEPRHDRSNTRRAVRYAFHHPGREVELLGLKAYYTYRHDHDGLLAMGDYLPAAHGTHLVYRRVLAWGADVYAWVMILLAVAAPLVRRDGGPPAPDARRRFLVLAGAVVAAAPFVFFGEARFKVPVVPFFAIGAAVTLVRVWPARVSGRRAPAAVAP